MTVYHFVFEKTIVIYIYDSLSERYLLYFTLISLSKKLCTYMNAEENQIKFRIKYEISFYGIVMAYNHIYYYSCNYYYYHFHNYRYYHYYLKVVCDLQMNVF